MAPPLAQSSPPGKEEQGGESSIEGKGLRNRSRAEVRSRAGGLSMSRARASQPPQAGASQAEVLVSRDVLTFSEITAQQLHSSTITLQGDRR